MIDHTPLRRPGSRRVTLLAVALAGAVASTPTSAAGQTTLTDAEAEAAATITAADLRARIGVLAHDSMRGRDTPSPELERAARYVAENFRAFGLRPGNGESYLQPYPLTVIRPLPEARQTFVLRGPEGERRLDGTRDFAVLPSGPEVRGEGPLVAIAPEDRTTDVAGRVVVIRAAAQQLQGVLQRSRELLSDGGAAGLILAAEAPPAWLEGARGFLSRKRMSLGEPDPLPGPVVLTTVGSLPRPVADALRDGTPLPSGWSARLETRAEVRRTEAWNVVGWLEGSDPALRDEYVVYTAHMDHVGVGRPVGGDSIYNGADDNASGTAAILGLAQAFATTRPRPRRSVVFMTVSGEEKGLLGSRWYSEHPLFPLDRTVANLNVDMIGRNWEDTVVAIGKQESTLGAVVDRVAAERPELGLAVIDDPWPEERFYFRSDHYNFARKGVPVLFFFSGVHEDYHRPSDEASRILYEKAARIVRLMYHVGREVADADEPPAWDQEAYRRVVEDAGG